MLKHYRNDQIIDYFLGKFINDNFDEFTEQHGETIRSEQGALIKKLLIAQKTGIDHHGHKKKRHEIMQRIVDTSYHEGTKENIPWAEKQNYSLSLAVKIRKNELMQKTDAIEGSASATTMQAESADQGTNQPILVTFFIENSQQFEKISSASALNRFRSIVKNVELIINLFKNSIQSTEKSVQSMRNLVQSKPFEIFQNGGKLIENSKSSFSYDAPVRERDAFASIEQLEPVSTYRFGHNQQDVRNNLIAASSAQPFQTTFQPTRDQQQRDVSSQGSSQSFHQQVVST